MSMEKDFAFLAGEYDVCKCGCGKLANHGEWVRGHWNKGKTHSDEANKKKGRSGVLNGFYGKKHSIESKKKISKANSGKKFSNKINSKKGLKGSLNPSYNSGYYYIYAEQNKTKKDYCEKCGSLNKLELHHTPSMTKENCQQWQGKVYTLCRSCHMTAHRNSKGQFEQIRKVGI